MLLLVAANFFIISATFIKPRANVKNSSDSNIWNSEDGGLVPLCGSTKFRVAALVTFDCFLLLTPIMSLFGTCAQFTAYWNVCFHGNHVEYIAASKAATWKARVPNYGSTGTAETQTEPCITSAAEGSSILHVDGEVEDAERIKDGKVEDDARQTEHS